MNELDRLAVYGTLGPGRPNHHHHLAELSGTWTTGIVHGILHEHGWGAAMGYPGIVLDELAPSVSVDLLESVELPAHWDRLDEFEGDGYVRVTTWVSTAAGRIAAQIYALADAPTRSPR